MIYFFILWIILISILIIGLIIIPIQVSEYNDYTKTFNELIKDIINGKISDSKDILIKYNEIESKWEDEGMIKRIGRKIYNICVKYWYGISIIGFIISIIGFVVANFSIEDTVAFGLISSGIGVISIGIACHSLGMARKAKEIANKSDNKMTALAELNFVEKNAMIEEYKNLYEEKKESITVVNCSGVAPSGINQNTSQQDSPKPPIKKLIRDLESAFRVVKWIKRGETEINKNFITALIDLTNIIVDEEIIKKFDKTDKTSYMRLLEIANQLECDECRLKKCKEKFEQSFLAKATP